MTVCYWKLFVILFAGLLCGISLVACVEGEPFGRFFTKFTYDIPVIGDVPNPKDCTSCPFVYFPVCGSDNLTYVNECKLNCRNGNKTSKVKMVRTGPCNIFPV